MRHAFTLRGSRVTIHSPGVLTLLVLSFLETCSHFGQLTTTTYKLFDGGNGIETEVEGPGSLRETAVWLRVPGSPTGNDGFVGVWVQDVDATYAEAGRSLRFECEGENIKYYDGTGTLVWDTNFNGTRSLNIPDTMSVKRIDGNETKLIQPRSSVRRKRRRTLFQPMA